MEKRRICWMDGSEETELPGKLLSDNLEYFGETIPTGATYRYLSPLSSIVDGDEDLAEFRGHRLQDGRLIRRFRKEPAVAERELVMEWDFQRSCTFCEVDFYCHGEMKTIEVACADGKQPVVWHGGAAAGSNHFYRVKLNGQTARRLRFTLTAENRLELFQVWAFGDTEEQARADDFSVDRFVFANSIAMESLMALPIPLFRMWKGFTG